MDGESSKHVNFFSILYFIKVLEFLIIKSWTLVNIILISSQNSYLVIIIHIHRPMSRFMHISFKKEKKVKSSKVVYLYYICKIQNSVTIVLNIKKTMVLSWKQKSAVSVFTWKQQDGSSYSLIEQPLWSIPYIYGDVTSRFMHISFEKEKKVKSSKVVHLYYVKFKIRVNTHFSPWLFTCKSFLSLILRNYQISPPLCKTWVTLAPPPTPLVYYYYFADVSC